MKKNVCNTLLLSSNNFALDSAVIQNSVALASENNDTKTISDITTYSHDESYSVRNEPSIQTKTWSKPQSWSVFKESRTCLGIETYSRGTKLSISTNVLGMNIKLGRTTSLSGQFMKYCQNARITVTYRVYRERDNKYIRTQTSTVITQYIDYIPI